MSMARDVTDSSPAQPQASSSRLASEPAGSSGTGGAGRGPSRRASRRALTERALAEGAARTRSKGVRARESRMSLASNSGTASPPVMSPGLSLHLVPLLVSFVLPLCGSEVKQAGKTGSVCCNTLNTQFHIMLCGMACGAISVQASLRPYIFACVLSNLATQFRSASCALYTNDCLSLGLCIHFLAVCISF